MKGSSLANALKEIDGVKNVMSRKVISKVLSTHVIVGFAFTVEKGDPLRRATRKCTKQAANQRKRSSPLSQCQQRSMLNNLMHTASKTRNSKSYESSLIKILHCKVLVSGLVWLNIFLYI